MQQNIAKEKYFLQFLVNSDKNQTKLIITIVNTSQMEAVAAIIYNLIDRTFNIKREVLKGVHSKKINCIQLWPKNCRH